MSTQRERAFESDGRLAARRGETIAASGYQRLRSIASRRAFIRGFEDERKRMTSETATPEQAAESQAAVENLKQWAKENLE